MCVALFAWGMYSLIKPEFAIGSASMWLLIFIVSTVTAIGFELLDSHFKDGDSYVMIWFVFLASGSLIFALISWIVSFFN
jgi:hypothetical protein